MPATAQSNTAERGKEVFRLNLLEKVEKHVNIIVLADDGFWEGKKTGYYKLDQALTAALNREGIPSSKAGSIPTTVADFAKGVPVAAEGQVTATNSTGLAAPLAAAAAAVPLYLHDSPRDTRRSGPVAAD